MGNITDLCTDHYHVGATTSTTNYNYIEMTSAYGLKSYDYCNEINNYSGVYAGYL